MEKRKVVPVWVSIVLLVLCAISIIEVFYMITADNSIFTVFICSLCICAVVVAVLYCFLGYRKDAAKYFMLFSVMLTLIVLLQIAHYYNSTGQPGIQNAMEQPPEELPEELPPDKNILGSLRSFARISVPVLLFGMLFTLTISKNLGKKKSCCLGVLSMLLSFINYLAGFTIIKGNFIESEIFRVSGVEFSILVLCTVYGVMIYAKYLDKTARGTK